MEFEVQKYLRGGKTLEDLTSGYGIECRISDKVPDLVSLNYNQINSPMAEQISQECRGLILEIGSWNVVSRSFSKFFNWGEELAAKIDWSTARISEKIDGSLIPFFFRNGEWMFSTKGTTDAGGNCGNENFTFRDLILLTISDMGFTFESFTKYLDPNVFYSFELTAFENQVIIPYNKRELSWLAAWDASTLAELDIDKMALQVPVRKPNEYPVQTLEELIEAAKQIESFQLEGFVVTDSQHRRIKIKSPSYLAADRIMCRLATPRRLIEFVILPNYDDLFSVLPPYKQEEISKIHAQVGELVNKIIAIYNGIYVTTDTRKDFAIKATKTQYAPFLFQLLDGKSTEEILQKINAEVLASWIGLK